MGWRLSTYVHVVERDAEGKVTGRSASFGPADKLPDWAVASISNPDVWAERGDPSKLPAAPRAKADVKPTGGDQAEVEKLRAEVERLRAERDERLTLEESGRLAKMVDDLREVTPSPEPAKPAIDGPPPKGGAGSGAPEWRAYAARKGVEVPADANREQVIAALAEANIPSE